MCQEEMQEEKEASGLRKRPNKKRSKLNYYSSALTETHNITAHNNTILLSHAAHNTVATGNFETVTLLEQFYVMTSAFEVTLSESVYIHHWLTSATHHRTKNCQARGQEHRDRKRGHVRL